MFKFSFETTMLPEVVELLNMIPVIVFKFRSVERSKFGDSINDNS